jgi:hypothetical protein
MALAGEYILFWDIASTTTVLTTLQLLVESYSLWQMEK